jgi:ABC-type dipeptide/oligopeptide/nickel transport system permease subunit
MRRAGGFVRLRRGQVGLAIVLLTLLVAIIGPLLAPHGPADIVGAPGQTPGGGLLLGTDYIGHDVLSRVLWGGWSVVWLSGAATALAYVIGLTVGLIAGYSRTFLDPLLMRSVDVILAFPPLLFFLIVATSVGTGELTLVVGIGIVLSPGIARIVYTATRETATRAFVEAAVARGESTASVLRREILPNTAGPIITNLGLTLTFAILLIAAVNFLNLGVQPPAANWALMVAENRPVLAINEWATIAPAVMIALLTVGVNLTADAVAEALGSSGEEAAAPGLERAPGELTIP